jgi:hypothetical protein
MNPRTITSLHARRLHQPEEQIIRNQFSCPLFRRGVRGINSIHVINHHLIITAIGTIKKLWRLAKDFKDLIKNVKKFNCFVFLLLLMYSLSAFQKWLKFL